MKTILLIALFFLVGATANAQDLRVVEVSAPSINCLFDQTCRISASDASETIALTADGMGMLHSRTFRGRAGSTAEGLYLYAYRVDLRRAVGTLHIPCLTSMTVDFGRVVSTLDFNGDGMATDQVFVISSGGIGSVGLLSAEQHGSRITLNFGALVCAGGRPGDGQSTFYLGLVSTRPPVRTTATVLESNGTEYLMAVRTPRGKVRIGENRIDPRSSSVNREDR